MELTRINLTGQQMPWWSTGITMGEVRVLRSGLWAHLAGFGIQQTVKRWERYEAFVNELRHATALEF